MFDINDLAELELDMKDVENQLMENFGDRYLADVIRIVSTQQVTPFDADLVYEAMTVLLAIYTNKLKSGEINQNKVLH